MRTSNMSEVLLRIRSLKQGAVANLHGADKHLNASNLFALPLDEVLEQPGPKPQRYAPGSNGGLEHALQHRVRLDHVELAAVEVLRGRLQQAGLEQLDGRGDAEKERELDPATPGPGRVSVMLAYGCPAPLACDELA